MEVIKRIISLISLLFMCQSFVSCDTYDIDPDKIRIDDLDFDKFKGKEMMIITVPKYESEIEEFVRFKESKGMNIEIDIKSASNGVDAIKNVLLNKYQSSGLQFVILIGDIEDVPSPSYQGAPSDPSYALFEGNDIIGDALISRISVKNTDELKNIMNKIVKYEKGEFENYNWISKAIVVGTSHFDGVNHTSGIVDVMRSKSDYFDEVVQILETDDDPHGDLMYAIETKGANMLVYNSHGSIDGFNSIPFKNSDIPSLTTFGGSFPFIHGAACSTGSFQSNDGDCFAEAILKTGTVDKPAGAISMLAFSRSVESAPPMMAQRIAFKEFYFNEEITTIGELCYFSNLSVLDKFNYNDAEMTYKLWHLFGDCSAPIWRCAPQIK